MRKEYEAPDFEVVKILTGDILLTASQTLPPTEGGAGGGDLDNSDIWDD